MIPRTDWRLVAVLFVVGLLAAAQFGKISLTLPLVAETYDRTAPQVAFLVSVVGIVGLLCGVIAGALVAALGARRVLLGCLCLGGVLSLLQASLPPLSLMTILRVAEGVSHLGLVVAAPPLMAGAATDRDRPIVMAIWATFFGVSFALTALAFPPLLAWGGLSLLFALHGAGLLALAAICAPLVGRQDRAPLQLNVWAAHRDIYRAPRLAAPGLGFVFYTLMFVALLTFLPGLLGRPDLAVTLPLVSLAGTMGAGWLAGRMAPDLVMAAGFAATAALTAGLWGGALWAVYPLFAAMGLVPGGAFALIPYLNAGTPDQARATGAIAQLGNVGTTLGTPLMALLLAGFGAAGLYGGLMALGIAGTLVVLLMRQATRRRIAATFAVRSG